MYYSFYRAMHFSATAKHGIAIVGYIVRLSVRPSVRLSVCV